MHNNNQNGSAFFRFIFILLFLSIVGRISFVLVPMYVQHYTAIKVIKSLESNPDTKKVTVKSLQRSILNRFQINEIDNISDKDYTVKKQDKGYQVRLKYEQQAHLIYNIDVVLKFDDTIEVNIW